MKRMMVLLILLLCGCAVQEPIPVFAQSGLQPGLPLKVNGVEAGCVWLADGETYVDLAQLRIDDAVAPELLREGRYLPLRQMRDMLGYTVLADLEFGCVYLTENHAYAPIPAEQRVPILMSHGIAEQPRGNDALFVRPSELEAQLRYLAENGYTTITFEDLPRLGEIEKPVLLTFDDGYDDNYVYLYPLLNALGQKATIFIISGYVNFTNYMTEEQIREVSDSGCISIQSHSDSHPNLTALDAEALAYECWISWLTLTRITGRTPFVLCYPMGYHNEQVQTTAADWYRYGVAMNSGCWETGGNTMALPRYYISRSTDLTTFAAYVSGT